MYLIGQNILLTNPHFETAILQPPQFLIRNICKPSDAIISDHFLSFLRDIIHTSNREMYLIRNGNIYFITALLVSVLYGYLLNLNSTCRFKIYRNSSYSDDHVRVVIFLIRVSRVFLIWSTDNIEFRHSTSVS